MPALRATSLSVSAACSLENARITARPFDRPPMVSRCGAAAFFARAMHPVYFDIRKAGSGPLRSLTAPRRQVQYVSHIDVIFAMRNITGEHIEDRSPGTAQFRHFHLEPGHHPGARA